MTVKEILNIIPKEQKIEISYSGCLTIIRSEDSKEVINFLSNVVLDGKVNEIYCDEDVLIINFN